MPSPALTPAGRKLRILMEQVSECDLDLRKIRERRDAALEGIRQLAGVTGDVLRRFKDGHYVVCPDGRNFWCLDGALERAVTNEEMDGVMELEAMGVLGRETK